jgi:hypothetical protein
MDNLPPGVGTSVPTSLHLQDFKMLASHGDAYEARESIAALGYFNKHVAYVFVFIIVTLSMFYLVGKKATTAFLLIVLLGQLLIPSGGVAGITNLTKNFKIFKGR